MWCTAGGYHCQRRFTSISRSQTKQIEDDDLGNEAFLADHMIPEQNKCLVDAGASVGLWTMFAAKKGRQVYSFEPSPKAYAVLKDRTKEYPNIHAYPYALGEKDSVGRIAIGAFSLSGSMDAEVHRLHKGGTIDIPVRSLDSLGISCVGVIKIDTEGYEIPILHGAKATIEKYRPRLIIEVHRGTGKAAATFDEELQRIQAILKELGYTWVQHNRQISMRDVQPHIVAYPKVR
jgi:FkbM family methyltransferase